METEEFLMHTKEDWMDYRGAQDACSKMTVPSDIVRIEKVLSVFFIFSPSYLLIKVIMNALFF